MAKRKRQYNDRDPLPPPFLLVSRNEAFEKINARIIKGEELYSSKTSSREDLGKQQNIFYEWDSYNRELLKRLFSNELLEQEYSAFLGKVGFLDSTFMEEVRELKKDIQQKINRLKNIVGRIKLFPEQNTTDTGKKLEYSTDNKNVFIVHGHDSSLKDTVARFLEKLNLKPIILHEQSNSGKTIIEKFELYLL